MAPMSQLFCQHQIGAFFKQWDESIPLDLALSHFFRAHKNLGSHDRRYIGDSIYQLVRWRSLFECLDPDGSIAKKLYLLEKKTIEEWVCEPRLPLWAQKGTSPFLLEQFTAAYGREKGLALLDVCNGAAPIAIRANIGKISRDELFSRFSLQFNVWKGSIADTAIIFAKREPLFALPEFKEGLFEMQDEGSQLVASLVEAKPGDRVLDYCSGSGGKSLAIAPKMQKKRGAVFA